MTAVEKIEKLKVTLILDYGFFATLLMQLELIEDSKEIQTMGTDGKKLYYNKNFVEKTPLNELAFVIIHEVMHCALGHMWRRDGRNSTIWNLATDYAINLLVDEISTALFENNTKDMRSTGKSAYTEITRPKKLLYDEKYKNMSADEIYDILDKKIKDMVNNALQKQKNKQDNSDTDLDSNQNNITITIDGNSITEPNNHDKWKSADKADENEKTESINNWEGNLLSANEQLKQAGVQIAGLKRIVDEIIAPQKDWRMLLQEFIQEEVNDYSLIPPDKRYDGDFFMFDFNDTTEIVKDLLFFVDTSGSMNREDLNLCYSEIQGAINQFNKNLKGTLLFFDASVSKNTYDFDDTNGDISRLMPYGGGGTSYKCIFDYIKENRNKYENINGVIILTDGYCSYPDESAVNDLSVLWVYTTPKNNPPFGRHTQLKKKNR